MIVNISGLLTQEEKERKRRGKRDGEGQEGQEGEEENHIRIISNKFMYILMFHFGYNFPSHS